MVAALLLDLVVIGPFLARQNQIDHDFTDATQKLADANAVFDRQRSLKSIWDDMQKGGLQLNASQAQAQAEYSVVTWAQSAGLTPSSLRSERTTQEGSFQVISFSFVATGTMSQISQLMWDMETAPIPIRVNGVQVTTNREGTDNLTVRADVSTLCTLPTQDKSPRPVAVSSAEGAQ